LAWSKGAALSGVAIGKQGYDDVSRINSWLRPTEAARAFDARRDPPRFLFLQVNKRCNLKCVHCAFWLENNSDKANYLDRAAKARLMREFAAMNPRGAVVICGGESMLDLEDYFDICRECRQLGLTCLSVVNGRRIRMPALGNAWRGDAMTGTAPQAFFAAAALFA
jgi:hypothetical protein